MPRFTVRELLLLCEPTPVRFEARCDKDPIARFQVFCGLMGMDSDVKRAVRMERSNLHSLTPVYVQGGLNLGS